MADKPTPPILLMTRPRAASERFVSMLAERRVALGEIVISPAIGIEPLLVPSLDGAGGVILTSANAVTGLKAPPGLRAWCVGDATAAAAEAAGFDVVNAGGSIDDLVPLIVADRPAGRLHYLRGGHVSSDLLGRLTRAGLNVKEHVVYAQPRQVPTQAAEAALAGKDRVVAPLFSPRSAAIFAGWAADAAADISVVAMSDAVAANWEGASDVSPRPTGEAMADAVAAIYARTTDG